MTGRSRSRARRSLWAGLAVAVVGLSMMSGLVFWTLDPASLKPRLIEAVLRATGRTLTISGAMGIKLSLVPTVSMDDVTLSNPPGFSRPDMVKVARVELGLALLPLLRHQFEVDHVTLVRPDGLLETDPAGRANWVFAQAGPTRDEVPVTKVSAGSAASPDAAPGETGRVPPSLDGPAKTRFTVSFRGASVVDGRVGWIDGKSGHRYEADTPLLTLIASPGGPLRLTGAVVFEGRTVELTAQAGPGGNSGAAQVAPPWPVSLRLESGDASITADGQIARPLEGRGYVLAIDANLPDPSALAPFFPRLPLESLNSVTAHADVSDSGGPIPGVSALRVKAGSVDLGRFADGARLEDVTLAARGNAPVKIAARVTLGGIDSGISGTIGDLPWLTAGAAGPVAVDLEWNAASGRASVKGTIQAPARFSGVALDVAVNVPDPSLVMNGAPPALKSVVFQTRVTDAPGPVPFQFTSTAGDLSGELSVSRLPQGRVSQVPARQITGPQIEVRGQISSRHLDLDMLRYRPPVAVRPAGLGSTVETPAPDDTAPVIPDTKLPFDLVRAVEGGLKFTFADVRLGGADVRRIEGAVSVTDGQLRLDPFTVTDPDQRLQGLLVADAAKSPPSVHLSVDAPGLALRPLLAALGLPQAVAGTVEVKADLTGEGDSPHAIAASLDGWAGMAVEGGQLDVQMVNSWLGPIQALHIGGTGVTDLRCLAVRADAKNGIVTIQPMALDTAALIVEGSGDVDLVNETLALRLRPRAKIGGRGIALPLRVSGPIRTPSARIDISPAGLGGGGLAGLLLGGKDVMGAAGGGDPCPAALARAREGASPAGTADDTLPHPAPGGGPRGAANGGPRGAANGAANGAASGAASGAAGGKP